MLLDGTCRPDVPMVLHYITHTLQRPCQQLKLCVVSHMHPDHAGGAQHYRQLCGTHIVASAFADKWYVGFRGRVQHLLDTAMGQFVAHQTGRMNRRLWYAHRLQPNHTTQGNQALPYFADWQVFCTPGHTDQCIGAPAYPKGTTPVAHTEAVQGCYLVGGSTNFSGLRRRAPWVPRSVQSEPLQIKTLGWALAS
jgi:hypothetical protein